MTDLENKIVRAIGDIQRTLRELNQGNPPDDANFIDHGDAESQPGVLFVNVRKLAQITGLPSDWLKKEAKANRIPHLNVGREMMFDVDEAVRCLRGQPVVLSASK